MRERLEAYCYTRKDFVLDWYSGSGAGGQHRNKHQNCLRLTHVPSGITVTAGEARDRPSNMRRAFERLKPKLVAWVRAQIGEGDYPRSDELVRTYHEADNRVTDHASGAQMAWSELDKRFGDMIEARARAGVTGKKSGRG
jgi:protein subunit release factor A